MFSISHPEEAYDMGFIDKMRNKFKLLRPGQGRTGRATGDPYPETKGEAQRASDGIRQVTEQVKDADKNVRKAFKP